LEVRADEQAKCLCAARLPSAISRRSPCEEAISVETEPNHQEEVEKSIWQKFCRSKYEGGQTQENKPTMCKSKKMNLKIKNK
jgi:hypothetical protein